LIEGRRRHPIARWAPWALVAVCLHVVGLQIAFELAPLLPKAGRLPPPPNARAVELVLLPPTPPPTVDPEVVEEDLRPPEVTGQIVETAPPLEERTPEEAQYLAEHDATVDVETRAERFKINPEVLAPEFSRSSQLQSEGEPVEDLDVKRPSTGATVGNHRFDPDRDGSLASVPSPWTKTNKPGLADPVMAASQQSTLAGAPQNDRLDEAVGDRVALNTREYLYAGYLKRIRRLVNFYWDQNLQNLPSSVRLTRSSYETSVETVLNADGALEIIEIIRPSGSEPLDNAVVQAFRIAGPFPNPPEGLVEKDGRVYLPTMSFEVQLGVARPHYEGIDPRAGVQFPGILKSPR
jgi:TonB family protein